MSKLTKRISPYIDIKLVKQLKLTARQRSVSESDIVNEALRQFFEPDDHAHLEKRLNRIDRHVSGLKKDNLIISEALGTFIHMYLTMTPQLPESERQSANAQAGPRFQNFIQYITDNIVVGDTFSKKILEDDS